MDISYSFYNKESNPIDQQEDLYNLAVAINNKNAQLNNSEYNKIKNDLSYPTYDIQGRYSNYQEESDFENKLYMPDTEYKNFENDLYIKKSINSHKKNKYKYYKNKHIHIDDNSSEDISETDKIDHIKNCNHCKKIFLNIIKKENKSNKHVFETNQNQLLFPNSHVYSLNQYQSKIKSNENNNKRDILEYSNQSRSNSVFSKEVILVFLIGAAIILILDVLSSSSRRKR